MNYDSGGFFFSAGVSFFRGKMTSTLEEREKGINGCAQTRPGNLQSSDEMSEIFNGRWTLWTGKLSRNCPERLQEERERD